MAHNPPGRRPPEPNRVRRDTLQHPGLEDRRARGRRVGVLDQQQGAEFFRPEARVGIGRIGEVHLSRVWADVVRGARRLLPHAPAPARLLPAQAGHLQRVVVAHGPAASTGELLVYGLVVVEPDAVGPARGVDRLFRPEASRDEVRANVGLADRIRVWRDGVRRHVEGPLDRDLELEHIAPPEQRVGVGDGGALGVPERLPPLPRLGEYLRPSLLELRLLFAIERLHLRADVEELDCLKSPYEVLSRVVQLHMREVVAVGELIPVLKGLFGF
mmetsp:Transcript_11881/g.29271  ORF Transcript_11881/g.29271 Transcript_11881/m.29271 type:complete len:272 (-) Transcript_11881:2762-3577(-)